MRDAFVATIRSRFPEPHNEEAYRRSLASKLMRWSVTQFLFTCCSAAAVVGMIAWRQLGTQDVYRISDDVFLKVFLSCLLIEATCQSISATLSHRLTPIHLVSSVCILHRTYQIGYLLGAFQMSKLAMTTLVNGRVEIVKAFACSVFFDLGLPICWHQQILIRMFLDGISYMFFQQVVVNEGITLDCFQRATGRFLLSVSIGFISDCFRRHAFLQTLRLAIQAAANAAHIEAGEKQEPGISSDRRMIEASAAPPPYNRTTIASQDLEGDYQQAQATKRIVIRIYGKNDDAIMAQLSDSSSATRASLQSKGTHLVGLSVRRGSIIAEMEVLVPNRPPEVNSTEINSSEASSGVALVNYGQWLDALRLYEVSKGTIGDGDMVTVSHQTLPLMHPPSFLPWPLSCCHTLPVPSVVKRVKEVTVSAMWLENDLDQNLTSLSACGINLEAVLNGRPLPIRLQPSEPRKWIKGQLVHFIMTLPDEDTPGLLLLNLWSTSAAIATARPSSSLDKRPCIMASSRPLLLLPNGCSLMADELDHIRNRSSGQSNIDALLPDVGRLLSAELDSKKEVRDCSNDAGTLLHLDRNALQSTKTHLINWCRAGACPHTMAFLVRLDFDPLAAPPPSPPMGIDKDSHYELPSLWLVFNIAKFMIAFGLTIKKFGSLAEVALLIYTSGPYIILSILKLKKVFSPRPPRSPPPPSIPGVPSTARLLIRWLFVENIGLLLHFQRLLNVFLMVTGHVAPVRGTPYDPLSANARNYWTFNAMMRGGNMVMEAYDIRVAAVVVLLLDTPSIYLYSTKVMGITHSDALIPSIAQILMGLVLQAVATLVRIKNMDAGRQLAAAEASRRAEDEARGVGPSSSGASGSSSQPFGASGIGEDKKKQ